ncbi:glycoside hydrolase family 3 C-terminal domain-containing protein [Lentzea sp.]|uniref:glycoside hydrolase family 3 C-terminal domain-containing protein n=1 Tax=Lentzea sp. TaxID=56099 RepID=UPI002C0374C1|nr:glycoside hydrolase family 3 C-terminal domain-containing protein [Lentzea sp.]HUQ60860.1 glycoside hydrolase family 3 C-terminal domain-containing protein [Lentzea sp.]
MEEAPFRDRDLPLSQRVADLLGRLTTAEKIGMLHQWQPAVPRLGIAAFRTGTEALHGVAWLGRATVFPQAIGLASTWNPDLVRAVGDATGTEVRGLHHEDPVAHGLNVWAPVVNPLRDPRWGRNEEGYSEDPLLTSVMGTAYASGLRGDHPVYLKTAPTLKHFLGYNNETDRCTTSSSLRARVLHEYELPCFRGPVEAGAAVAVMPSYNLVNGRPAHLTPHIEDHLRGWGEVAVVSDAWAPSNVAGLQAYLPDEATAHAAMLLAGLDSFTDHDADPSATAAHLTEALARGLITEEHVDRAAGRLLALRFRLGEFDPPDDNPYAAITGDVVDDAGHRALALEAARQSIVLLKNDGLLPLGRGGRLAVIGTHANVLFEDWYCGTLPYSVTPLAGITKLHSGETAFVEGLDRITLSAEGVDHVYDLAEWGGGVVTLRSVLTGRYLASTPEGAVVTERTMPGGWDVRELFELTRHDDGTCLLRNVVLGQHLTPDGFVADEAEATRWRLEVARSGVAEAVALAETADVAIVVVGNDPHINGRETQDRADLDLPPKQAELVRAVRRANPRTVLVLVSSYPYAVVEEDEHVPAILWSSHGGQEFGHALAEVLFGEVSPSGRLTQTWYRGTGQLPDLLDYDIIRSRSTYLYFEGDPLYEFGHGLSYTRFSYGPLTTSSASMRQGERFEVSVEVTNAGDRPGAEVVQLYGSQRDSRAVQPLRRLVAFERVPLAPGESRVVRFPLNSADFWHWDVVSDRRVVETSVHDLWIGPWTRARTEVRVIGEDVGLRGEHLRAELFDDCAGIILSDETVHSGTVVESTETGGWILLGDVLVEETATHCTARVAGGGGEVVLRTGGEVRCTVAVPAGDPRAWQDIRVPASWEPGVHDVVVVFSSPGIRLAAVGIGRS